ncbi:MAG: hypothetical protein JST90_14720 [Bacteroidetes bacterium]|nr:hypothetical protein [Bacteroidota bacterium]
MEVLGATIIDAWEKSIVHLLRKGDRVPTQRGMNALELQNVLFLIAAPADSMQISGAYPFSEGFIQMYTESLSSSYKGVSIKDRLYNYEGRFDQIKNVVRILKKDPSSRRATVSLWNVESDHKSTHPPCMVTMQFYIRDSKLHLTAVLRSNDAWMAAVPDMLSAVKIQIEVAGKLKVPVGSYNHLATSYHIYETDIVEAERVFQTRLNERE